MSYICPDKIWCLSFYQEKFLTKIFFQLGHLINDYSYFVCLSTLFQTMTDNATVA